MSRRVSFSGTDLERQISNPSNKEHNKNMSQSSEEYQRNVQMAKTGFLRNSGRGAEFEPKKLEEEIRGHCAKGDENFCHKAIGYLSNIFKASDKRSDDKRNDDNRIIRGGKKRRTRTKKYKSMKTKKRKTKRRKTLKK